MLKLNLKTLKVVYLYSDGHAVLKHEKYDTKTGVKFEFVELVEKFGPRCDFKTGRVIISSIYDFAPGIVKLVQRARSIDAKSPSILNGSERTREKCLQVGYLHVKHADYSLDLRDMPGIISGEYTYQEHDHPQTWEDHKDAYSWAGYPISKRYFEQKETTEVQECA